jgi:tetratricopeptide (TPR) repeat protein
MGTMRHQFTALGILLGLLATTAPAAEPQRADALEVLEITTITPPLSAAEHVDRAIDMASRGQLEQAIAEYTVALQINPDSWITRLRRATTYGSNRQWQEARADFAAVLTLEPENPIALGGLGIVELELGRPLEAIELLRKSLNQKDELSIRRVLINAHLAAKNYDSALVEMQRYARQNPADGMYLLRIETLLKAGRGAEVETVVGDAVAARTGSSDGRTLASLLYSMAGQNDRAFAIADEAIREAPSADRYYQRAMAEKDPARQRADLQDALKLSPRHILALAMLADVHLKLNDFRAAMLVLDQIEAVSNGKPLPADFFRMRGDAKTGLRDKPGASHAYANARAMAKNGQQLNSMCWAKATKKAATKRVLEEALKDCNVALTMLPECWNCHDSRGLVMLRLKRFKDAIISYDAALGGDSRQTHSLYGRGIARLRSGRKSEGEADIAAAVALTPDIAKQFKEYGIRR